LKDVLPRLPILQLLNIENISHDPSASLKKLQETLQIHINNLQEEDKACLKDAWPHKVSSDLKEKIAKMFIKETSSQALATFVCASCAEDCSVKHKTSVNEQDISLSPLHRPDVRCSTKNALFAIDEDWLDSTCTVPQFSDNQIDHNALLDPQGISDSLDGKTKLLSFCSDCHKNIVKGKTPPLALANHMTVGDTSRTSRSHYG